MVSYLQAHGKAWSLQPCSYLNEYKFGGLIVGYAMTVCGTGLLQVTDGGVTLKHAINHS